jgi:23S rRNA (adenine2503-C2)-methyltransferase
VEPIPTAVTVRVGRGAQPRRRYDLSVADLAPLVEGEPAYRVKQIWQGLISHGLEIDELTTLPKPLREKLTLLPELGRALELVAESVSPDDMTIKWLWRLHDGSQVETVLMHYADRSTVCISSQAGCAMACGFCATGQGGFQRHLTPGEIVEQVAHARKRASTDGRRLSNVVYMGMGEPMANYGAVWTSIERLHGDFELSARHLTISTVGIVPGIRKLAAEPLPVNLAVSLHAANDDKRNEMVPINRTYPLAVLADACHEYIEAKNRRLSFEWAMIDGVNDTEIDAYELADYARPLGAHINLIPLNSTPGYPTTGTAPHGVRMFRDELVSLGLNATIRQNRGTSIDAACGQLAARHRDQTPGQTTDDTVPLPATDS